MLTETTLKVGKWSIFTVPKGDDVHKIFYIKHINVKSKNEYIILSSNQSKIILYN